MGIFFKCFPPLCKKKKNLGILISVKNKFAPSTFGGRAMCITEKEGQLQMDHTPFYKTIEPREHSFLQVRSLGKKKSQGKSLGEHCCFTSTTAWRIKVQKEEQGRRDTEGPVWPVPFVPSLDLPSQ